MRVSLVTEDVVDGGCGGGCGGGGGGGGVGSSGQLRPGFPGGDGGSDYVEFMLT